MKTCNFLVEKSRCTLIMINHANSITYGNEITTDNSFGDHYTKDGSIIFIQFSVQHAHFSNMIFYLVLEIKKRMLAARCSFIKCFEMKMA